MMNTKRILQSLLITAFLLMPIAAMQSTASAETVLNMPPPPKPAQVLPQMNIEEVTNSSDVVTWRDRRNAADIAGPHRSYLGTVALTRYRRYRSTSYNRYIVFPNRFPQHHIQFGFGHGFNRFHGGHHFPFNVSFLHGVPTHHGGYDWPWSGFGRPFRFFGTW